MIEAPDHNTTSERRARQATLNRSVRAMKMQHSESTLLETIADRIAAFAGSASFLVFHVIWFGAWVLWNSGRLPVRVFDPFPFGLLTMVVSLEAIFLAIFILMSQNREARIGELREETTLAVQLRTEAEVTKTLQLVAGLYTRMGYQFGEDDELQEMLRPLDAHEIERELVKQLRIARRTRTAVQAAAASVQEDGDSPSGAPPA